jgi:hypothetical protein
MARLPRRWRARGSLAKILVCLAGVTVFVIACGSLLVGMASASTRPSCATVSPQLIATSLGKAVEAPTATPWDRGTLNCSYHFVKQPSAGTDLVLIGYLIHGTSADWQKFVSAAAKSGHAVTKPPIGRATVGYTEPTSPKGSNSVLSVFDGQTIFTILTVPAVNFVSLEHLAKQMVPLLQTSD